MNKTYSNRFGHSTPDTRNMDTLAKQAARLRECTSIERQYIDFVADNMERIAAEYAACYQKLINSNSKLLEIASDIEDHFENVK